MKLKFKILTIMSLCLFAAMAMAQDSQEKKPVDVSGVIYANYVSYHSNNRPSPDNQKHGFDLERAYVNFRKDLGDNFSVRLTTDASNYITGTARNSVFLKFAYAEYKNQFGDIGAKLSFGLIGNAIFAATDNIAGMRWLTRDQLDLCGIYNTADLGASAEFNFFKIATLNLSVYNGDGFNTIQQAREAYKGKEFNGVLTITPIETFYINLFYSYMKSNPGTVESYMGGGLAWSDKLYKVGANAIMVTDSNLRSLGLMGISSSPDKGNGLYIDSWLNVNFKDLIGMPITLNARFGYIIPDEKYQITGTGTKIYNVEDAMTFGVGPGYQINNNVQFALWGEYSKVGERKADMAGRLKTEIKF
jgi:hypothetical protein